MAEPKNPLTSFEPRRNGRGRSLRIPLLFESGKEKRHPLSRVPIRQ